MIDNKSLKQNKYILYTIIIITFNNIIFSYILKIVFNLQTCIICYLLLISFKIIMICAIINLFVDKYKLIFIFIKTIFTMLALFLCINKIFFEKNAMLESNCISMIDSFVHLDNIFKNLNFDCHIIKNYFLGIQLEVYILITLIIIKICLIKFIYNIKKMKK